MSCFHHVFDRTSTETWPQIRPQCYDGTLTMKGWSIRTPLSAVVLYQRSQLHEEFPIDKVVSLLIT